jgi:hypothetical protein
MITSLMPPSAGASESATGPCCSTRGAASSTTDTCGFADVAPSAHLTETSESGSGPDVAASAVLTVQDRATVTLIRRSEDEATCARGGAIAISTSTGTPTHRSDALV